MSDTDKDTLVRPEEIKEVVSEKEGEKKSIEEFKQELKAKLEQRKSLRTPKIKSEKLKIAITKPEKEVTTPLNEKAMKQMVKITPEQMNLLVNGISNTVTFVRQTEQVELEESAPFAKALYEVADANGWLDDMSFLPYLVLTASGVQLALVIISKPKKPGASKIIEPKNEIKQAIGEGAGVEPEVPKGNDYDMIDGDALVKKIQGIKK